MRTKALAVLLLVAAPMTANAADDEALVEKAVVRNRLFSTSKRFEIGLNVGFSVLSQLTDHYVFDINAGFNITDWFAIELLAGYAYAQHTSLADDVQSKFEMNNATSADDLRNLWEMTANGFLGVRFQPIYGKIGLFAEYPLHFQFYASLGAGGGLLTRTSTVICNHVTSKLSNGKPNFTTCDQFLQETKGSFIGTAALGMRFFVPVIGNNHSVRFEVRGFLWPDSFFTDVNREIAATNTNNPTGGGTLHQDGVTFLPQIHIGYAYMF
jgi:outer membrane beta-barrel protein